LFWHTISIICYILKCLTGSYKHRKAFLWLFKWSLLSLKLNIICSVWTLEIIKVAKPLISCWNNIWAVSRVVKLIVSFYWLNLVIHLSKNYRNIVWNIPLKSLIVVIQFGCYSKLWLLNLSNLIEIYKCLGPSLRKW
jgi:hypothetical protein